MDRKEIIKTDQQFNKYLRELKRDVAMKRIKPGWTKVHCPICDIDVRLAQIDKHMKTDHINKIIELTDPINNTILCFD
jgi:hypothetical protein